MPRLLSEAFDLGNFAVTPSAADILSRHYPTPFDFANEVLERIDAGDWLDMVPVDCVAATAENLRGEEGIVAVYVPETEDTVLLAWSPAHVGVRGSDLGNFVLLTTAECVEIMETDTDDARALASAPLVARNYLDW